MKYTSILAVLAAASLLAVSCKEGEGNGGASAELSNQGFFSQEKYVYSLNSVSTLELPVARLGTAGDLNVTVTATGASEFTVPGTITIKDGDRIGVAQIAFDKSALAYMESYELTVTISGFNSIYGYGQAVVQIDNPMPADFPYEVYGSGKITEGWWGEVEEKDLMYRDCGGGIYQCYLPECWGHDSGAGYPVQDYVFFWDTRTNKLYIPFQFMGCEDWCVGDQGSIACKFGGPNYGDGLRVWREYIDNVYKTSTFPQPHYDPATRSFYLSDSAACSPKTGAVVYGSAGEPDVFKLY